MTTTEAIIIVISALLYFVYRFSTRNYNYWKKRNVVQVQPIPVVGNFWKVLTLQMTFFEYLSTLHHKMQNPYFGVYIFGRPALVVRDPELIKDILARDFRYFSNRGIYINEKCDPLSAKMLFALKYPEWHQQRLQMSSFFTKKSVESMTRLMEEVGHDMVSYIENNMHQDYIKTKELAIKYTTDVISSCALGVKANSFQNDHSELCEIGKRFCNFGFINVLRQSCYYVAPAIVDIFRLPFLDPTITRFFKQVFWETVRKRKMAQYKRDDMIDIAIEMMQVDKDNLRQFDDDAAIAQALVTFFGGSETTSTAIAFTLYELALNFDIQKKLREELKSAAADYRSLTYESIHSVHYLDMVISETLRKYPPVSFLERICTKRYKVPHSDLIIEEGTPILISTMGLNTDPEYFPKPEEYNPERFSNLNKDTFTSLSLPFGFGPRDCIGKIFGITSVKIGVASVILNYEVELCAKTPIPVKFEIKSLLLGASGGLPLKFKRAPLSDF